MRTSFRCRNLKAMDPALSHVETPALWVISAVHARERCAEEQVTIDLIWLEGDAMARCADGLKQGP